DYTYQVCAHYSWADSEMSPSHTLHFVQYHIPQNFTAQLTGNDVSLSWIAPDDTTFLNGYRLYRNEALLVQTTETSYTDHDLPNGMYTYQLKSLYDDQESYPIFAEVSIILPQSPQNVVAEVIYSNCVQITWDSLSMVYGFEKYELWRNGSMIYEGSIDSYTDVVPNGLYHYSVIAVYQDSVSEPSEEASLSVILPQPLLETSYTIDTNNVTFHWQAPDDTYGFTCVEIWRAGSLVATVLPEAGNSYSDVNVGNGHYWYELRSVYGDHGYSPTELEVMIVVPYSPDNFQGEVNGHIITLLWDPPADTYYLEGYRLIQGIQVTNLSREAVSYNAEALPNGSYEYSLQSVYEGNHLSGMQTIRLNISQVYPVSSVTASRLEDGFRIDWEAPQCLFAPSRYEIHLLPEGPNTPADEWILLESDCQELFYLDTEHGGLDHGNFVWAVTAKWGNDANGIPVTSNAVYVEEIPEYTWLIGNYPNPFNPHTSIRFWLKEDSSVSLMVYNARGQKVRTLINESMRAGIHDVQFNGKDDAGRDLGSGVYFSLLKSGPYHRIRKMILSK
ncbi:MAG TPA: FlgD immunoglobulin-like domain containing protein, partial [Candidatus Cloacimonadota bacterium]|nr:FlgD immunoglobulin-like domain containing protein [Candidatus Cloacimonadota bacterium]